MKATIHGIQIEGTPQEMHQLIELQNQSRQYGLQSNTQTLADMQKVGQAITSVSSYQSGNQQLG